MKKKEIKETITKESVVTEIICDKCKKTIAKDRKAVWDTHFQVTTSHHRWGNDSIDSIEHYDFCSLECLSADMNEYYTNGRDTEEYEISLTKYNF